MEIVNTNIKLSKEESGTTNLLQTCRSSGNKQTLYPSHSQITGLMTQALAAMILHALLVDIPSKDKLQVK